MSISQVRYPIEKATKSLIFLNHFIHNPNIIIGDYTYYDGGDKPEIFEQKNVIIAVTSKLTIGKFCQIAYGTKFILNDANHQMSGFSTFPFFIFGKFHDGYEKWADYTLDLPAKGDTVIGNDVWFGHECTIMPGVTIGDGAIIGAKAVVVKDVAPYAVVAGNPGKEVRRRFSDETVKRLIALAWWDWNEDKITRNIAAITGGDIDALESAC